MRGSNRVRARPSCLAGRYDIGLAEVIALEQQGRAVASRHRVSEAIAHVQLRWMAAPLAVTGESGQREGGFVRRGRHKFDPCGPEKVREIDLGLLNADV